MATKSVGVLHLTKRKQKTVDLPAIKMMCILIMRLFPIINSLNTLIKLLKKQLMRKMRLVEINKGIVTQIFEGKDGSTQQKRTSGDPRFY